MKKKNKTSEKLIAKIFSNPRYRGKHLVIIAGKIFTASTGAQASRIFNKLTKKYPGKIPTITYIPKEDALILWLF